MPCPPIVCNVIFYDDLFEDDYRDLTEDQYRDLGLIPNVAPSDPALNIMYTRYINIITNPTGYWKDYNQSYRYYLELIDLEKSGLFKGVTIPDPPNPADYSILV